MTTFDTSFLDQPFKKTATLISFEWGVPTAVDPGGEFYSDVEDTRIFFGRKHTPLPKMEISLPKMTGTISDERARVTVPLAGLDETIWDYMSDGLPFARTLARIDEVIESTDSGDSRIGAGRQRIGLYAGYVAQGYRNPRGKKGLVTLELMSPKGLLANTTLGAIGNAQCNNVFGGPGCERPVGPRIYDPATGAGPMVMPSVQLTMIDSTSVRLIDTAGSGHLAGKAATYWDEGSWRISGLRFKIRSWQTGTNEFVLYEQPRLSLLNQVGELWPGCDKSLTACRFWQNEDNFDGCAWASPDFNPLYEVSERQFP